MYQFLRVPLLHYLIHLLQYKIISSQKKNNYNHNYLMAFLAHEIKFYDCGEVEQGKP